MSASPFAFEADLHEAILARREGRHDRALSLLLDLFAREDGTHAIFMIEWRLLVGQHAPAREAMVRERAAQAERLLAGDITFGDRRRDRFSIIADMNEALEDSRATYELFLQMLAVLPEVPKGSIRQALPAIVEAQDYVLAQRYVTDPLSWLAELNTLAEHLPLLPAGGAPRMAAELANYVRDLSLCETVWRGLGRLAEADALRAAAIDGIADDALRTMALRELAAPGTIFREFDKARARPDMTDIRYTKEEDWQELKRIRLAALQDAPQAFGVSHASAAAYTDDAWRDRAAGRGKARFILAFDGGEAVGIVGHVPNDQQELELIAMWVAPSHRGTAVATHLVDMVKSHAASQTYQRILLDVAPNNQRAAAFYQKLGFAFLPEWEPLESHPHIQLQKMEWLSRPGLRSVAQLRKYVDGGGQVKMLMFWGHQPSRDGAITKTCFSQWFEASFEVDGIRYLTAEHYMMAEKARLFGDEAARQRVLAATNPGAAKAIGREVLGFDNQRWLAHRWDIVVRANMAKFSQNAALRTFLLDTQDRVLVEASPVDAIWGIGLGADDPRATDPAAWEGLNLLGFALMEVRSRLHRSA
ncbi:GNAT family N-acetyltransferase [Duganella sp. FT109W]|uniref:GNAT family N-acetyltransferase n=2 Tax=Duganella margarita TaxID=2692170 RepID=A0ABW9WG67_9BURK|nr:GNAT family N-acetyltransferase [Duganella margarita]